MLPVFAQATGQLSAQDDEPASSIRYYIAQAEQSNYGLHFDSAVLYCDSAISLAESMDSDLLRAYSYGIKGNILRKQHELSVPFLRQAILISEQNKFDSIRAAAYLVLGVIMAEKGQSDSIYYYHNKALSIYQQLGDSAKIAKAKNNLGYDYMESGNYDKALQYLLESYHLYQKIGITEEAISPLLNLGNLYEHLSKYDTAIACYDMVYDECVKIGKPEIANKCKMNKAVILYKHKDYKAALKLFLQVIDFNESINDEHELIMLYSNVSLVYRKLGRNEEAMNSVKKSLKMAETIHDIPSQMKALNNLAIFNKRNNKYTKAEKYYLQSLELAEKAGYNKDRSRVLFNLSILYQETGDFEKALEYYHRYADVKDSMLNISKVKVIAELEAMYEKKNDEAKILRLQNEKAQKELEKKDIRLERNTILGTGTTLVIILIMSLVIYRIRNRKNKIIAEQKIQQLEDDKNLLEAQSVIVGQENERKRIAQELHDGIGVLLSTAKIHFSKVLKNTKDEATMKLVKKADKLLKDAGEEVRGISHNMMPGVLSKFGLADAIEDMLDEVADSGKAEVDIDLKAMEERLPENTEIMLFRVVQELVNNTLKYADAKRITISAKKQNNYLHIQYADDGKGFDEKAVPQNKSLGISGIRSRVNFLKGKVQLKSTKGEGTVYLISIPV
jgi:signal transduction histidine kinase